MQNSPTSPLTLTGSQQSLALKKPKGAFLVDGRHVSDTAQCVHCSAQWEVIVGSGRRRGWCTKCNGMVCGSPNCDWCIPTEARLEAWEKGKTLTQALVELDSMSRTIL